MPYIAFDLLALEQCPNIARLAKCSEDAIIAGFTRLWAHCWRQTTDLVSRFQLVGLFGEDVADALVAFEFLAVVDGGYRVRGAERYLRIQKARSVGGQKSKANLIPGGKKRTPKAPKSSAQAEPQPSVSREPAEAQPSASSALTSNIEHRTSKELIKSIAGEQPPAASAEEKSRLKALSEKLVADYAAMRPDAKYLHQGARDTDALKRLCAAEGDDEIIRGRWRYGLRQNGWLGVNTFAQLALKFNDLAGFFAPLPGSDPPRPVPKPKPIPMQSQEEIPW